MAPTASTRGTRDRERSVLSRRGAAAVLWIAAALVVPLPYFVVAEGAVPVVRMAMLASIGGAYSALVDGSGVAWPLTLILALHVVAYAAALGLLATAAAHAVPARARTWAVAALVLAAFAVAVSSDVYRTPFDDAHARTSWTGLFD